ncbi:MAG: hypothetical protein IS632_08870 [Thaumarchaeota archaeon]|nr:hypothetical protein [Nitrososphaerota archaeon]
MGLTVKISKGREYLYFQAGKNSIYIGPKDDASRVKTENVVRALEHSQERVQHYLESLDELLALLPEPLRRQYLLKQASTLRDRAAVYTESARKQTDGAR